MKAVHKSISLAMIVKNEATTIEKAILSAKPFVDEIVIGVDSSSMDDPLKIGAQYVA